MKRRDILSVITVGIISAVFSYILSGVVFGSPHKKPVKVPVVEPISTTFAVVSDSTYKTIFNSGALNPTQLIRIGGQVNSQPFSGQ